MKTTKTNKQTISKILNYLIENEPKIQNEFKQNLKLSRTSLKIAIEFRKAQIKELKEQILKLNEFIKESE